MNKNKLKKGLDFLARVKTRQARGASWFIFIVNFGVITANVRLFFPDSGMITYILCAIVWLTGTTIVGHVDEFKGIWKREYEYVTETINPVFKRIDENVKTLLETEKKKK